VHAVGGDGVGAEYACLMQAVRDALAALAQRVLLVGGVLGEVSVKAQAGLPRLTPPRGAGGE